MDPHNKDTQSLETIQNEEIAKALTKQMQRGANIVHIDENPDEAANDVTLQG